MFLPFAEAAKNFTLQFYDCTSLYGSVSLTNDFPLGPYKILGVDELEAEIVYDAAKASYMYQNDTMLGLCLARIVPPTNLKIPYLPLLCETKDGKNPRVMYTLCKACATRGTPVMCNHWSPSSRGWVGCYVSTELGFAKSLGYDVYLIEAYVYSQRAKIFEPFVAELASMKLINSGFPTHIVSLEDRWTFCNDINEKMQFPPHLRLTPDNVRDDPLARKQAKLAVNALLMKFSQKIHSQEVEYVKNLQELHRIKSQHKVTALNLPTKDCCEVTYDCKTPTDTNIKSCLSVSAFLTSYARHKMWLKMSELDQAGATILYHDTDSILMKVPNKLGQDFVKAILDIGYSFGQFRPVLENASKIESFYCIGERKYSVVYREKGTNILKFFNKVAGFQVHNGCNSDKAMAESMKSVVKAAFKAAPENKKWVQVRKRFLKRPSKTMYTLKANLRPKRLFLENKRLRRQMFEDSIPFGFKHSSLCC